SLPEACGPCGLQANPHAIDDIHEKLVQITENASLKHKLMAKRAQHLAQFEYEHVSKQLYTFYQDVMA
ncbi:MAG: hypothetical protein AAGK97_00740, partial [Bacteroidota bacterium]